MKVISKEMPSGLYMMAPQNYSVNDGEGIRTVLFFAQCPLRCQWCANPESFVEHGQNEYVRYYSMDEIMAVIDQHRIFYRYSAGGVTFSGGEATRQVAALEYLSKCLYDDGINLTLETSGHFDFERVKSILKRMDLIFVDLKVMDDSLHQQYTGASNKIILENIALMGQYLDQIVVRIPLIVGVNVNDENILETAKFVKKHLKKPKIELLPYHTLGSYKYEKLGLETPSNDFQTPSQADIIHVEALIRSVGIDLVSYK